MKLGAIHSSERAIYQRRANEDRLNALTGKLRQEFHSKEFARWENKGNVILEGKQQKLMLQQLRQESARNLTQRRERLAQLIRAEDQWCKEQIISLEETPEKVREKMAARVQQLKSQRQNERKDFVATQRERQFEANTDELRKVDAQILQLKTNLERNIQVIEKQEGMMSQYRENLMFAELDRRDVRKKEQAEREILERAKEKERERNAVLAVQLQLKQNKKQSQKLKEERQKAMLREQWTKEKENAALLKNVRAEQNRIMAEQILRANEQQKKEKQAVISAQKVADKEMIDRIILKEKELQQLEKAMKQQQKEENRKFLLNFKSRANQLTKYQKELDRLIEEERARQQAKKLEEWERQEEARIKLLRDVYADREKKVYSNIAQVQQEKRNKGVQREWVDKKVAVEQAENMEKKRERLQRRKQEELDLLAQIRDKEQKRQDLLRKLAEEEEALARERQAYQNKIKQRKVEGLQALRELRTKAQF